ncbi:Pantothenate kinase type III, CoaX-like [hydrothermal vent metagenome]|uniref:Type III pantothenate kinase n=1 Tax=hydrothermal vent metagenome TaxID=652676 RepID=A0A3B1C0Q6_9ZZZZ
MTSCLLVVDIGNTHIVLGVFEGAKLMAHWRIATKQKRTEDELAIIINELFGLKELDIKRVNDMVISCVSPPVLPSFIIFAQNTFSCEPLVIGPGVKTGVSINIDNPREVGADRIANAAGALASHKPPFIIVDFGTAITIDMISADSEYMGGAIVPGVRLSLNALYHHAAKLPEVEFIKPPSVIGRNTVHSMQSGAYYGYASLVDGIVSRMKEHIGPPYPMVIATGGEAGLIAPASETITIVEDNLTLVGLRAIHEKNRTR